MKSNTVFAAIAIALLLLVGIVGANNICTATDLVGAINFVGACKEYVCLGGGSPTSFCTNPQALYHIDFQVVSGCNILLPLGNNTSFGANFFSPAPVSRGQPVVFDSSTSATQTFSFVTGVDEVWTFYLGVNRVSSPDGGQDYTFVTSQTASSSCTI